MLFMRRWFMRQSIVSSALAILSAGSLFAVTTPALTELGQAINAYNARDFGTAIQRLRNRTVPGLADYVTYYLASSEQMTAQYDDALAVLTAYREHPIASSPLAGRISLLHARVLLDKKDRALAMQAMRILQIDSRILPQPDGDFAMGLAAEGAGENVQAAQSYQRVYYSAPNTDLGAQSWSALDRLRGTLGPDFPQPSPAEQIERCEKWLAAKQYAKARLEYTALADTLTGPERYVARVGIGVADYMAGSTALAFHYLQDLRVASPEADAERLYYVVEAARRVVDDGAMTQALHDLDERYPQSPWRMKALIAAGNRYVSTNDRAHYTPLFRAACDSFPSDPATAGPHWRLAWDAYTDPSPERAALLREQVQRYPSDGHVSSALYFLGRVAESEGRLSEARAYYDALNEHFPHYFYASLAKDRKRSEPTAEAEAATAWLATIAWPKHRDFSATVPNTATEQRIVRTRLLVDAGQPDLAEAEARFGIRDGKEQAQLLALDLARSEPSTFKALHLMKGLAADYLSIPTDGASTRFWQMLFPLPWKDDVFRNAASRNLSPYDVAALIRQESEFNPNARSHANAYGLMQLLPGTGRMLGRQQGIAVTSASMLFNPSLNIELGTKYLRAQLDTWAGDWYRTLAAYNAGPSRVRQWTSGTNFHEPLEFVENIPFDETREYVQAVLRNADMYKELYAKAPPPEVPAARPVAPSVTKKKPAVKKKPAS
jgi:soluble lytic murein transglycosylase